MAVADGFMLVDSLSQLLPHCVTPITPHTPHVRISIPSSSHESHTPHIPISSPSHNPAIPPPTPPIQPQSQHPTNHAIPLSHPTHPAPAPTPYDFLLSHPPPHTSKEPHPTTSPFPLLPSPASIPSTTSQRPSLHRTPLTTSTLLYVAYISRPTLVRLYSITDASLACLA